MRGTGLSRGRSWLAIAFIAGSLATGAAPAAPRAGKPSLHAGAAKVDITPAAAELKPGESIRDPLFVRTIYLKSGRDCAIIVSIDKGLVPTAVVDAARKRLRQCPRDSILVAATHTHSGHDLPDGFKAAAAGKRLEDAIVKSALEASRKTKRARMGFATTDLHLNVNRDALDGVNWYQGTNRGGASDKTMAVLYFVDDNDMPIGMMMNYGMHPINYYLSGIVSSDFSGDAAKYIEQRYPGAVALFTQAGSGDQNPLLSRPLGKLLGPRLGAPPDDRVRAPSFWERAAQVARERAGQTTPPPPPATHSEEQKRAIAGEVSEIVAAMGAIMGETAIEAMRDRSNPLVASATLRSDSATVTCPGRDRISTASREGFDPGYRDGEPVKIQVGLLRLGDIALFAVDSELYTEIIENLKRRSPLTQTAVIGLANGLANSGYIYSDNAAHHLTFQVVGSRLHRGCAEHRIIDSAVDLIQQTGARRN